MGTMITINTMMTPKIRHILIFISFHHMSFLTRLAPRRKPCALIARLSVLFSIESNLSPRSATLLILSLMIPTVSSICYNFVSIQGDSMANNARVSLSSDRKSIFCDWRSAGGSFMPTNERLSFINPDRWYDRSIHSSGLSIKDNMKRAIWKSHALQLR